MEAQRLLSEVRIGPMERQYRILLYYVVGVFVLPSVILAIVFLVLAIFGS